jgi:hypothetical protein
MSYRLITKATLILANNEIQADVRAYAAPKGASVGEFSLNGESTPFKLTGGQGRGTVVRCYMYFMLEGQSAYIEINKDQLTELKAGNHALLYTQAAVEAIVEPVATQESPEGYDDLAPVEQPAPKAKRTRKGAAVAA